MAQIHAAHSDLEDKLQEAERGHEERRLEYHIKDRKRHNAIRPWLLLLGAVCILVFFYLLWQHEIPRGVRLWFAEDLAYKPLLRVGNPWIPENGNLLSVIFCLVLNLVWPLVCLLARFLMPILGWLVWLLMYLLPLAIGGVLLIIFGPKEKLDAPLPEMTSDEAFVLRVQEIMEGTHNELGILKAGVEGEWKALEYLESLPDDCHIYTNLRIPYDGAESETDMVVVTPAGVTIVEVKNYKGTISGDTSDENLVQVKHHRDEDEGHEKYNPFRQVGTHAYRLAGYLRTGGVRTYARTCVFFVNEDVTLRLTDRAHILTSKCPVFKVEDVDRLCHYLQNSDNVFSGRDYQQTLELLNLLVQ